MFRNRVDAGRRLADALRPLRGQDVVVLGLPRGGVPVAVEVARALDAPLDVIVVRKLGLPSQPELAMGAIAEGGIRVIDGALLRAARVSQAQLDAIEAAESAELDRRAREFRDGRPRADIAGRTVVIVDDGIATGSTARVACLAARKQGAARVIVATPVASESAVRELRDTADEVVALSVPHPFYAVGQFYADFRPTSDRDVVAALSTASRPSPVVVEPVAGVRQVGTDEEVAIQLDSTVLAGRLTVPIDARGAIVFAHGSGSSRHSPRNRAVAAALNQRGFATLLFDLLTRTEEADRGNVFDIPLLGDRLARVTDWLRSQPTVADLDVGYFGASTGAAAALWAAAALGTRVAAVVSRGGRPDLAWSRLTAVRSPTLLIVGSRDPEVLELNRRAATQLRCEHQISVVHGATHLFEEPGALSVVTDSAAEWFSRHLAAAQDRPQRRGRKAG